MGRGATKITDLYGIGTVMYEMLTGNPPYYNDDLTMLYEGIKYGELDFPKGISSEAKDLI
jgi:serum/glucocorticoid-regulated kinase 2